MSDVREVFPTLEDGSNAGAVLRAIVEGDSTAAKNGHLAFGFKDSSGNAVLPQLNDEGAIVVSEDAGTTIRSRAEDTTGSASLVALSGSEIVATLGEKYSNISAFVSCLRDTLFQIVHIDDVGVTDTETVLLDGIVGPGSYSLAMSLDKDLFDTTGGTGVQNFALKYQNFNALSTVRGSLSVNELPA